MYITKEEILNLRKEVQNDLDEYIEIGRNKKRQYIVQDEDRILLEYVVELLNEILVMLHRGNYIKEELFDAFREQDWIRYSFSSKSLWSDKLLRKRLQIRPSKKINVSDMLWIQAEYLEKAAYYIITRLE